MDIGHIATLDEVAAEAIQLTLMLTSITLVTSWGDFGSCEITRYRGDLFSNPWLSSVRLSPTQAFLSGDCVVTKKEIVKTISEEIGLTQLKTKEIVQKTFDAIVETLVEDRRIELRNFGVFEVKKRAARKARNPRTGEKVAVPEKFVVTFKPGKEMEERVRELERQAAAEAARLAAQEEAAKAGAVQPAPESDQSANGQPMPEGRQLGGGDQFSPPGSNGHSAPSSSFGSPYGNS